MASATRLQAADHMSETALLMTFESDGTHPMAPPSDVRLLRDVFRRQRFTDYFHRRVPDAEPGANGRPATRSVRSFFSCIAATGNELGQF
jgi:hypothetical protein